MGLKSQYQVSRKQRIKRKAARKKLTAKDEKLNEYFYGKYYIKASSQGTGY